MQKENHLNPNWAYAQKPAQLKPTLGLAKLPQIYFILLFSAILISTGQALPFVWPWG